MTKFTKSEVCVYLSVSSFWDGFEVKTTSTTLVENLEIARSNFSKPNKYQLEVKFLLSLS